MIDIRHKSGAFTRNAR